MTGAVFDHGWGPESAYGLALSEQKDNDEKCEEADADGTEAQEPGPPFTRSLDALDQEGDGDLTGGDCHDAASSRDDSELGGV